MTDLGLTAVTPSAPPPCGLHFVWSFRTTEPPKLSAFRGGRPAVHIDGDVYPTALAVGDRFAWPRRREQGGDGWVPNLKAVV